MCWATAPSNFKAAIRVQVASGTELGRRDTFDFRHVAIFMPRGVSSRFHVDFYEIRFPGTIGNGVVGNVSLGTSIFISLFEDYTIKTT